jgi:hypothetical protein
MARAANDESTCRVRAKLEAVAVGRCPVSLAVVLAALISFTLHLSRMGPTLGSQTGRRNGVPYTSLMALIRRGVEQSIWGNSRALVTLQRHKKSIHALPPVFRPKVSAPISTNVTYEGKNDHLSQKRIYILEDPSSSVGR